MLLQNIFFFLPLTVLCLIYSFILRKLRFIISLFRGNKQLAFKWKNELSVKIVIDKKHIFLCMHVIKKQKCKLKILWFFFGAYKYFHLLLRKSSHLRFIYYNPATLNTPDLIWFLKLSRVVPSFKSLDLIIVCCI